MAAAGVAAGAGAVTAAVAVAAIFFAPRRLDGLSGLALRGFGAGNVLATVFRCA